MNGDRVSNGEAEKRRVAEAVRRHVRASRVREAEEFLTMLLDDPRARESREELEKEELRGGEEMAGRFPHLRERYDTAERSGDVDVLARICPGKHGRWGRICLLDQDHDGIEPHWGYTPDGVPVAWIGSAPDGL